MSSCLSCFCFSSTYKGKDKLFQEFDIKSEELDSFLNIALTEEQHAKLNASFRKADSLGESILIYVLTKSHRDDGYETSNDITEHYVKKIKIITKLSSQKIILELKQYIESVAVVVLELGRVCTIPENYDKHKRDKLK